MVQVMRADMRANPRDFRNRTILFWLRLCQYAIGSDRKKPRRVSYPLVLLYRVITEMIMGTELRPTTRIGEGLTVFHGFGLVVNPDTQIGNNVKLRNGVVIGNKIPDGPCPRIEDGVEVGANAVILGDVTIGRGAVVGAGAVVIRDVAPHTVVAGNPAKLIRAYGESA